VEQQLSCHIIRNEQATSGKFGQRRNKVCNYYAAKCEPILPRGRTVLIHILVRLLSLQTTLIRTSLLLNITLMFLMLMNIMSIANLVEQCRKCMQNRAHDRQNKRSPRQIAVDPLRHMALHRLLLRTRSTRTSSLGTCQNCHSDKSSHESQVKDNKEERKDLRCAAFETEPEEHDG